MVEEAEVKEGGKKVTITDECVGCGACAAHTVTVDGEEVVLFDVSSGKSEFVYSGEMTEDVITAAEAAAEGCPVQAIVVE